MTQLFLLPECCNIFEELLYFCAFIFGMVAGHRIGIKDLPKLAIGSQRLQYHTILLHRMENEQYLINATQIISHLESFPISLLMNSIYLEPESFFRKVIIGFVVMATRLRQDQKSYQSELFLRQQAQEDGEAE